MQTGCGSALVESMSDKSTQQNAGIKFNKIDKNMGKYSCVKIFSNRALYSGLVNKLMIFRGKWVTMLKRTVSGVGFKCVVSRRDHLVSFHRKPVLALLMHRLNRIGIEKLVVGDDGAGESEGGCDDESVK